MRRQERKHITGKSLVKRAAVSATVGALAFMGLTGCGDSTETSSDGKVQKIVIGAISTLEQWGNLDENGELDGYEIAVLKAIDERLPQYEFEIQGSNFDNILLSLDTGKIDLGTNMFEYNDERAEKYLYGEEGYIDFSTSFIIPVDSEYTTWDSLAGKVFGGIAATDNSALIVQKYNEENPDKALLIGEYYGEVGTEVVIQSLLEGRWDAVAGLSWSVDQWNEDYGNGQDIVKYGDIIGTSESYYLYPKDGQHEELQQAVDEALKELKEDGILKQISEKYFGFDITPKEG